jgi:hypothetical protein
MTRKSTTYQLKISEIIDLIGKLLNTSQNQLQYDHRQAEGERRSKIFGEYLTDPLSDVSFWSSGPREMPDVVRHNRLEPWDAFSRHSRCLPLAHSGAVQKMAQFRLSSQWGNLVTMRSARPQVTLMSTRHLLSLHFGEMVCSPAPVCIELANERRGSRGRDQGKEHRNSQRKPLGTWARRHRDVHGEACQNRWANSNFRRCLTFTSRNKSGVQGLPRIQIVNGFRPSSSRILLRAFSLRWQAQTLTEINEYICHHWVDSRRVPNWVSSALAENAEKLLFWRHCQVASLTISPGANRNFKGKTRPPTFTDKTSCRLHSHRLCTSNSRWLFVCGD